LEAFFAQRLAACDEAPPALQASGDGSLVPLVDYWRSRLTRLRELFRRIDADLVSAFRPLQEQGRLEIIGSAATHGYLPLLGRDESIRLQLAVGQPEHRRLFGVAPVGCWLPECAYRPYRVSSRGVRPGVAGLVRDPRSSRRLCSRHEGYRGDEWYVEFHKVRRPGVWNVCRVSGANGDLGGKRPYEPWAAHARVMG